MKIPFMKPPMLRNEREYLIEAFDSGFHHGGGPFSRRCQDLISDVYGIGKTLLTTSCTDALEMAALLLKTDGDDEVIVPSYTFSSTVNAFACHGYTPVYVDIRPDTLNIDESLIEEAISPNTRAIVAVHYAGIPAEMDTINTIAEAHGIPVVEDAAQAVNSRYKGRFAGALCQLGTFSFHGTKSYSCGEGGALLMNDSVYFERSEFLLEKGTDRSLVVRGMKNKYSWVDYGSSFLPSDLLAAMLLAQLENRDELQNLRKRLHVAYDAMAEPFKGRGLSTTIIPDGIDANYHAYWLLFPESEQRDRFIDLNKEKGVVSYIGYIPLHSSPMGRQLGGDAYSLPITDRTADCVVRLPFYLMEDDELSYAVAVMEESLRSVFGETMV